MQGELHPFNKYTANKQHLPIWPSPRIKTYSWHPSHHQSKRATPKSSLKESVECSAAFPVLVFSTLKDVPKTTGRGACCCRRTWPRLQPRLLPLRRPRHTWRHSVGCLVDRRHIPSSHSLRNSKASTPPDFSRIGMRLNQARILEEGIVRQTHKEMQFRDTQETSCQ